MNSHKQTKRALLTSVMALVMCVVMLVGTTFAWFTDTASTNVNTIKAGKLDIALEMKEGTNWVNAEGKTLEFKKAANAPANEKVLWEPGCTYELPQLRVVNNGNLALKYKIQITGIQGDAKLNEVIDWTINDADINLTEEHLLAGQTGAAFTIKGHMQDTADNTYMNEKIDGIAITVYATQDTVENDSYGPDYDKDAPIVYPEGLTKVSFENATSVYYYNNYGGASVKTATGEDINSHPAVVAYVNAENNLEYAADFRSAIENGASVIYFKADSTVPASYNSIHEHINVTRDLTIYGNGASFNGGDLTVIGGIVNEVSYAAPANDEVTVNIYQTKNMSVWGQSLDNNRTWNINFYDCANEGDVSFLMYQTTPGVEDLNDKVNLTMTNCSHIGGSNQSAVCTNADGSVLIKNCTFIKNCAPVNIGYKQSSGLTVTVENSAFNDCGSTKEGYTSFCAPIRINKAGSGTLNVTLTNNNFTDTIGENGDILLTNKTSNAFTAEIVTDYAVMVKSTADAAHSCNGGTITVTGQ